MSALPDRRIVIRFEFSGVPASRTKYRIMWLLLDRSGVDVCVKDPGYAVDLLFCGKIADFVAVYLGHAMWRDMPERPCVSRVSLLWHGSSPAGFGSIRCPSRTFARLPNPFQIGRLDWHLASDSVMSAIGTKRIFQAVCLMSAIGGKADMARTGKIPLMTQSRHGHWVSKQRRVMCGPARCCTRAASTTAMETRCDGESSPRLLAVRR